jgi:ubiquinone/menaquinone biosynthesis C-methylase UbiE
LTQSKLSLRLTGIDVASTVVEEARAANPGVTYHDYDGDRLPYPDQSFDAAYTIAVMHHVPPPQWPAFLQEMRRVVRPGGLIVIFEHNPINPLTPHLPYRRQCGAAGQPAAVETRLAGAFRGNREPLHSVYAS